MDRCECVARTGVVLLQLLPALFLVSNFQAMACMKQSLHSLDCMEKLLAADAQIWSVIEWMQAGQAAGSEAQVRTLMRLSGELHVELMRPLYQSNVAIQAALFDESGVLNHADAIENIRRLRGAADA